MSVWFVNGCVWRPEVDSGCLPSLPPTLFFAIRSLSEPEAHPLVYLANEFRVPPVSALPALTNTPQFSPNSDLPAYPTDNPNEMSPQHTHGHFVSHILEVKGLKKKPHGKHFSKPFLPTTIPHRTSTDCLPLSCY